MEYWELEWVLLLLESKTIWLIFFSTHNDRKTCLVSKNVTLLEEHRDSENEKYDLAGERTPSNCPGESSGNGEQKGKANMCLNKEGKYVVEPWISPRPHFSAPLKAFFFIPVRSSESTLVKY